MKIYLSRNAVPTEIEQVGSGSKVTCGECGQATPRTAEETQLQYSAAGEALALWLWNHTPGDFWRALRDKAAKL